MKPIANIKALIIGMMILFVQSAKSEQSDTLVIDFYFIKEKLSGKETFYTNKSCTGKIFKKDVNDIFLRAYIHQNDTIHVTDSIDFELFIAAGGFFRWFTHDIENDLDSILNFNGCAGIYLDIKNIRNEGIDYSFKNSRFDYYFIGCKGNSYSVMGFEEIEKIKETLKEEGCIDKDIFIYGPFLYYEFNCK